MSFRVLVFVEISTCCCPAASVRTTWRAGVGFCLRSSRWCSKSLHLTCGAHIRQWPGICMHTCECTNTMAHASTHSLQANSHQISFEAQIPWLAFGWIKFEVQLPWLFSDQFPAASRMRHHLARAGGNHTQKSNLLQRSVQLIGKGLHLLNLAL